MAVRLCGWQRQEHQGLKEEEVCKESGYAACFESALPLAASFVLV